MDEELSKLLSQVDLRAIVDTSIQAAMPKQTMNESFVAQAKTYTQVSEYVSQKTKDAHKASYESSVKTMNRISAELDSADRNDCNNAHSQFRSLKIDETSAVNRVFLHELYFANCFSAHSTVYLDSPAYLLLEKTWGTFDDWQKDFIACSLNCGVGWVVCGYNMFLKRVVNTFVTLDDSNAMLGVYPLVVLDCHPHAYFRDYTNDVHSYCVAMMRTFDWEIIDERVKKMKAIEQALK